MSDNELFSTNTSKGNILIKPGLQGKGYHTMIVDTECHSEELTQKINHKARNSTSSTELIPFDFNYEYQLKMA